MLEQFIREEHSRWDTGTHHEVVVDDCYEMNNRRFTATDVVIDVGANIGFFSGLALEKGTGLLIAVEPSPSNFAALARNLYAYGKRKSLYNRAVWRSDIPPTVRHLHEFPDDGNTGGIGVLQDVGEHCVLTISLDDLIGGNTVSFLKIDCEGSEYPILYTSQKLTQVKEMIVECHPVDHLLRDVDNLRSGQNTPQGLASLLAAQGFRIEIKARAGMADGWAYLRGIRD